MTEQEIKSKMEQIIKDAGADGFKFEKKDIPGQLKMGFRFFRESDSAEVSYYYQIKTYKSGPIIFDEIEKKFGEFYNNLEKSKG